MKDHVAGFNVLHVDDEDAQLKMARFFLNDLDPRLNVVSCGSPRQALKLLSHGSFDCIISDYMMPGMTGIEFAEKVKSFLDVPFILYTGQGSEDVAQQAFQSGIDDYVQKDMEPSHYEVLLNSLKRAIDKHRAESLYKTVFESNRDGIVITVGDLIAFVNDAAVKMYGVDDSSYLIGHMFMDFVRPEEYERASWLSLSNMASNSGSTVFEFSFKRLDGEVRDIEFTQNVVQYLGQEANIYFIRDITTKKKMESSLRSNEYQMQKLFDSSPLGIALIDESNRIEKSNNEFIRIMGLSHPCHGAVINLLETSEIRQQLVSRLFTGESVRYTGLLDFRSLSETCDLPTKRSDKVEIDLVISPIYLSGDRLGHLLQIRELEEKQTDPVEVIPEQSFVRD